MLVRIGTYWYTLVRTGTCRSGKCWYVLLRVGACWYVLMHTGTNWYVLAPIGVYWYALVRFNNGVSFNSIFS